MTPIDGRARAARRPAVVLGGAMAAVAIAACTAGGGMSSSPRPRSPDPRPSQQAGPGPAARPVPPGPATSWLAYHADAARSGLAAGLPPAGNLAFDWFRPLDGAVYGQPLVVRGLVIAATENDSVYGLDRATGRIRWRRHLGTPLPLAAQRCGDLNPLGITSTPVYDRSTGLVYVLAQVSRTEHLLAGLSPATGVIRYRQPVPAPDGQPYDDQQRGALAAANGWVYVTFGGHYGDCGPYRGSVVGMPVAGHGRIVSFLVRGRPHGGIWAAGGPLIAPDGTVYVGVGNGAKSPPYDGSDSVLALSPSLHRIGFFAPATWSADNRGDADLGSMTPALIDGTWLVIVGKSGIGYLVRASRLGGVGGQVSKTAVCASYGGAAVDGSTVFVPCASGGPAAVAVPPEGFGVRWRGPAAADGSPVVGGGAVWVTDTSAGVLYEVNPATGQVVHAIGLGARLPHFASPSLSGRLVLIGTLRGVVAVGGA